jgi:sialic acid synthase SpsE
MNHLRSVRPGNGLAPKEFDNVIGIELKTPVKKGTAVSWEVFKNKFEE